MDLQSYWEKPGKKRCIGHPKRTKNKLFFQSALGRQSAVETKSPNQGQSATRGVQSATEEGQTETWESKFDIA